MRRTDEQTALNLIAKQLRDGGQDCEIDNEIVDIPDGAFLFDQRRVGIECTNVNLERLLKWSNSTERLEKRKQYVIDFAFEPHFWAQNSIEEKKAKIPEYQANVGSDDIWLAIHALEQPTLFDCNEDTIAIMIDCCRFLQPDFDEIWFIHAEFGTRRIWKKGWSPVEQMPHWDCTKEDYPRERILQSVDTITKDGLSVKINFDNPDEKIYLEPLDRRFR